MPLGRLVDGDVSLREYCSNDADGLFEALRDERAWEHIAQRIPRNADELDSEMQATFGLARLAFTVRQGETIVGTAGVLYDTSAPAGVEIGPTQLNPLVWGTGVHMRVKRVLVRELFAHGAEWIQLRADERNDRSAAAIRKLGALDLGVRQDIIVRRDGSTRRSRFFRLDRPAP
jgi:N-acetyltransferase